MIAGVQFLRLSSSNEYDKTLLPEISEKTPASNSETVPEIGRDGQREAATLPNRAIYSRIRWFWCFEWLSVVKTRPACGIKSLAQG
jgi:hypothetical protein